MPDLITIIVKDIKGDTSRVFHTDALGAMRLRKELDQKYPFPDYDVLEVVSEEKAFIFTQMQPEALIREIEDEIRAKKTKLMTTAETPRNSSRKAKLVSELWDHVEVKSLPRIDEIADQIETEFSDDWGAIKQVGLAYSLLDYKVERALKNFKKILAHVEQANEDPAELHFLIGNIYLRESNFGDAFIHLDQAAQLEEDDRARLKKLGRAAYTAWKGGKFDKAMKLGTEKLRLATEIDDEWEMNKAKNSLAYFRAEVNKDLEEALSWCLDLLQVKDHGELCAQIVTRKFERHEARYLDTLSHVLESLGELEEAFLISRTAYKLNPTNPVIEKNKERLTRKLLLSGELKE